jgi:phosphoglycolate phosphatase
MTSGLFDPVPTLVIFDFDGTLADTWDWLANELVAAGGDLGIRPIDRREVETLRSKPTRDVFRRLGISLWRLPWLAAHIRRRAEAAAGELRLFEGASEMITTLRDAGITLAITSSNSEVTIRYILGDLLAERIQLYACETPVFGKASRFRRIVRKNRRRPAPYSCRGRRNTRPRGGRRGGAAQHRCGMGLRGHGPAACSSARADGRQHG